MKSLVDTNLLVYSFDVSEPAKHKQAVRIIRDLTESGDLVLSVQVLNELASVALRKKNLFGKSLSQLGETIMSLAGMSQVLPLSPETTRSALAAVERHQLSFWDALIWATASAHGVPRILSEDFQHGRRVEGVEYINPLLGA
ncbi:MAG TPA: PIN domain-containing protein [Thermoanaerobaculia bacterium]|jgi:predicted nucleic acid-binding protein|nr:PIN domain-containing protein [Thermoanaerobaculia bacterium]